MAKNRTRQLDLRFAVGSHDGPRSGVWRVVDYRSDVYLAPCEMMHAVKVNLHRDRTCLFKVTGEHRGRMEAWGMEYAGPSYFARWTRPDSVSTTLANALLITFPMEGLAPHPIKRDPSEVIWLTPPSKGEAVKVAIIFINGLDRKYDVSINPPGKTLGFSHLDNGETAVVAARTMPINLETRFGWYKEPRSGRMNYLTPNQNFRGSGLLRGVFHGDPPAVGTFELFDMA